MKKVLQISFVFIAVFAAFYFVRNKKDDPNAYSNLKDVLILPFDTNKVLSQLKIVECSNEVSLYKSDPDHSLLPKLDTIDLVDMHWACDCPNWRYADSLEQNNSSHKDFYIEPADEKLVLPDCLKSARIQFIGREYGGSGYSKNSQFEDPHPPAGRVFKYYAYKIFKPYSVWGPIVQSKENEKTGASILVVK